LFVRSPELADAADVAASTTPLSILTRSPEADVHNEEFNGLQIFNDPKRPTEERTDTKTGDSTSGQSPTWEAITVNTSSSNDNQLSQQTQMGNKVDPSITYGSKRKFGHADEDSVARASMVEDDFEFRRLVKTPEKTAMNARSGNVQPTQVHSLNDELHSKESKKCSRKILQPSESTLRN
jgi:hypothetical protein